jgi:hypothetical protein
VGIGIIIISAVLNKWLIKGQLKEKIKKTRLGQIILEAYSRFVESVKYSLFIRAFLENYFPFTLLAFAVL